MNKLSFPKSKRLVSNEQFKSVLVRKVCVSDRLLRLYIAENDCSFARLGVSVGKSCGCAVVRNRLKRLLREAFRQNEDKIPVGFDYLFMISPGFVKSLGLTDFKKAVKRVTLEQIRISMLALAAGAVEKIKKTR